MKIIVYSTPVCPYCQMAKDYLKEKKLDFQEINVAVDTQSAKKMVEKTNQMGVPVIEIDGNCVVGFDKEKIDQLIDLEKGE